MILLIDGDMLVYRLGWACNGEEEWKALSSLDNFIAEIMISTLWDEPSVQLYLSGKSNFRHDVAVTAPYKGNRKSDKPVHFDALRLHMLDKWEAIETVGEEADDAIAIAATAAYPDAVIVSLDKDFLQVPGNCYDFVKKIITVVTEETGLFSFYVQMLVGDRVDNIIGVKGVGPVTAKKLLEGKTEAEMYAVCVEQLGSPERALENGRLLWLRRYADQLWNAPVALGE